MELKEIAERVKVDLGLKKAKLEKKELKACCPNPNHEDKKPSWSLNVETFFYNCWSCGFSGRGIAGLFLKLGKVIPAWVHDLPEQSKRTRTRVPGNKKEKQVMAPRNTWLEWLSANVDGAYGKLKERDIELETLKKFGVGYNAELDIIYCPCINGAGNLVGWGERSDKWDFRWKVMPEGVHKTRMLFGENHIEEGKKNNVYVVEGVVDALKMWQWGFKAVAVMGSHLYQEQAERIMELASQVIVIPDNDKAGLQLRYDVVKYLRGKVVLSGANLPEGIKDVGENKCTIEVVKKAIVHRIRI